MPAFLFRAQRSSSQPPRLTTVSSNLRTKLTGRRPRPSPQRTLSSDLRLDPTVRNFTFAHISNSILTASQNPDPQHSVVAVVGDFRESKESSENSLVCDFVYDVFRALPSSVCAACLSNTVYLSTSTSSHTFEIDNVSTLPTRLALPPKSNLFHLKVSCHHAKALSLIAVPPEFINDPNNYSCWVATRWFLDSDHPLPEHLPPPDFTFIGVLGQDYATYHSVAKAIRRAARYDVFHSALNSARENWTLPPSITIRPRKWLSAEKEPRKPVAKIRQPRRPCSDACPPVQPAPSRLPKKTRIPPRTATHRSRPPLQARPSPSHPTTHLPSPGPLPVQAPPLPSDLVPQPSSSHTPTHLPSPVTPVQVPPLPSDRVPRSTSPQQISTFTRIPRPVYPTKRPRIETPLQNRKRMRFYSPVSTKSPYQSAVNASSSSPANPFRIPLPAIPHSVISDPPTTPSPHTPPESLLPVTPPHPPPESDPPATPSPHAAPESDPPATPPHPQTESFDIPRPGLALAVTFEPPFPPDFPFGAPEVSELSLFQLTCIFLLARQKCRLTYSFHHHLTMTPIPGEQGRSQLYFMGTRLNGIILRLVWCETPTNASYKMCSFGCLPRCQLSNKTWVLRHQKPKRRPNDRRCETFPDWLVCPDRVEFCRKKDLHALGDLEICYRENESVYDAFKTQLLTVGQAFLNFACVELKMEDDVLERWQKIEGTK